MVKRIFTTILLIFCLSLCCCAMQGFTFKKNYNGAITVSNGNRAKISITCMNKTFNYSDDIFKPTNHMVAETIFARSINASLAEKLKVVQRSLNAGAGMREAFNYCFPLIGAYVDRIVASCSVAPTDSTITFCPNSSPMFKITREQQGHVLTENRIYYEIFSGFMRGENVNVSLTPAPIKAAITTKDNIELTNTRSKFSTSYVGSDDNRKHNIRLSLSKINGTVLQPSQQFSFNDIVGKRLESDGYKQAKIILDGSYVLGFGGGVCQSSTTIYNAALRADMQIDMAKNHSLVPSYVPPSMDAMVNSGGSDLKFTNTSKRPVFIKAVGTDTTATVEFFGTALAYRIDTKSVEISRGDIPADDEIIDIDRKYVAVNSPPGQRLRVSYGHASIVSEGYTVYYDLNNNEISRKLTRRDTYIKTTGIIAIAP